MPVDVEMPRVGAVTPPLENIEPPCVARSAHTHMVRNHIDNQSHAAFAQFVDEPFEARFAAAFGAHLGVVDRVVAVHRTRLGCRDRRRVQMADAERSEVFDAGERIIEREVLVELKPECGTRDCHGVSGPEEAVVEWEAEVAEAEAGVAAEAAVLRARSTASSRSLKAGS